MKQKTINFPRNGDVWSVSWWIEGFVVRKSFTRLLKITRKSESSWLSQYRNLYLARAILTCDKPESARVSTLANFRGKLRRRTMTKSTLMLRKLRLWRWFSRPNFHFVSLITIQSLNPSCFVVTNPHLFYSLSWFRRFLRFHFEIIIIFYFFLLSLYLLFFFLFSFFDLVLETTFTKITSLHFFPLFFSVKSFFFCFASFSSKFYLIFKGFCSQPKNIYLSTIALVATRIRW